jgi:tetratricopeptide (TPR) repeat protein
MIVKNEEKNLADCLTCVRDLVDEMVVVDTGSADRTKQIARDSGAKVFDFPWVDSFAAARNEALRHATREWVFWLDADDRIDEPNRQKLRRLFESLDLSYAGFDMKCRCVGAFPGDVETVVDHVRLFRNDPRVRWEHRVHEQVLGALRRTNAQVHFCDVEIRHVGYTNPELKRRKLQRDLRLLLMEHTEHADHPFTLFNLASSYLELGQPAEALSFIERSLQKSDPADSIVRKLYGMLARAQRALRQPTKAFAACTEGRKYYPDDPELLLVEAWVREDVNDLEGAELCLRRLVEGQEPGDHFASVASGLRGHLGRHSLAHVLLKRKRYAEAEAQWRTALTENPHYRPAWLGLGEVYLKTEHWPALEQVAEKLGEGVDAAVLTGQARLARKQYGAARWAFSQAIEQFPDALLPRVFLSHALLQEGRDWNAAEKSLRDILTIDPGNTQARQNLEVLLRQQERYAEVAPDGTGEK